ncbi:MAG: dicarboxylate/amino acid:cation symporter [Planctomycetes bacterium]|nr:dicarboxylate/amino acid:cation symporter [Planctomycetota bacterium]
MSAGTPGRGGAWRLPMFMALGGLGGVWIGWAWGDRWTAPEFEPFVLALRTLGTVFLSALKALMVPLVVLSMVLGVQQMGAGRAVGRMAGMATLYFGITTLCAVLIGLSLVTWIHPGSVGAVELASGGPAVERVSAWQAVADVVTGMFPPNLIDAAARGNVLGLIVASLVGGVALSRTCAPDSPLIEALGALNRALFIVVHWVVAFAPIGIGALVADRLGRAGGGEAVFTELQRLVGYSITVLLGLAVHSLVVLPTILWLVTRRNPLRYFLNVFEALATAFGTASSAATLGVTLRCVVERNAVSRKSADFVLPIGATVNMDGTALYEAVAAVFIAQSLGIELDMIGLAVVALTATLAAVGAAAIPEAGLVTMVLVLQAVGLPAEGVGLLLAVDWILDRFRTATNVWGDTVGAAVIDDVVVKRT